jgi:hypothetical protein
LLHKDGLVSVPFASICALEMIESLDENFKMRFNDFGRLGFWGSIYGRGWEFLSLMPCSEQVGGHPASYQMGTGSSFPGGKAAGA